MRTPSRRSSAHSTPVRSFTSGPGGRRSTVIAAWAVVAAVSLTACGGDSEEPGGSGGSGGSVSGPSADDTPAETVQGYVNALRAGDFATALAYVAEPGEVSADALVGVGLAGAPEIVVSEEDSVDPGEDVAGFSVSYTWSDRSYSAEVTRTAEGWRLSEALHIEAIDTEDEYHLFNELADYQELGEFSVAAYDGTPITEAHRFLVMTPETESQAVSFTVTLDGLGDGPEQTFGGTISEGDVGAQIEADSEALDSLDFSAIIEPVADLVRQEMYFRSKYFDLDSRQVRFQHEPMSDEPAECFVTSTRTLTSDPAKEELPGSYLDCGVTLSGETLEGGPVLDNSGPEVAIPGDDSRCALGSPFPGGSSVNPRFLIRVLDGEATVLWDETDESAPDSDTYMAKARQAADPFFGTSDLGTGACDLFEIAEADLVEGDMVYESGFVLGTTPVPGEVLSLTFTD